MKGETNICFFLALLISIRMEMDEMKRLTEEPYLFFFMKGETNIFFLGLINFTQDGDG